MERGRIIMNNTDYTGSFVTPNPSEPPTKDLNTLEIEGEVFNIAGGGGGGGASTYFGVFVDTQNVILPETRYTDGTSYTATHDCYCFICYQLGSGKTQITLDGVDLVNISGVSNIYSYIVVNLTKEQTLNFISTFSGSFYLTVYGVKSGSEASYFQPIIYSTEEREVGVWTDDKPLYQKTFYFQLTDTTSYLDLSSLNVENVVYEEGYVIHDNGKYKLDLPYYESDRYKAYTNYITDGMNALAFYVGNGILTYYKNVIITIQYTKTTDVAGSGEYNTLGIPNVHYDGNEKIIGTWFGKTLYQKTLVIHNESTVSSNTTITTIDSTFRVKNWKAFAIENGVHYKVPYVAGNGNASFYFRENGNVEFKIKDTSFAAGSDFYITIEYTKTTD